MAVPCRTPICSPTSLIAGYTLKRQRGSGSFGNVWEAHTADHRVVAFKSVECTPGLAALEVRNARTISDLKHPNLVRIEKVWCEENKLFFVMELAEGSLLDLSDVSTAEFGVPLSAEVVCGYFCQVAEAVDFLNAHRHTFDGVRVGIQHRDIKPSNLLLFGDKVKICDFGLATKVSASSVRHQSAGTPAFAGPEVFQQRLTDWSDQYSFAVSYCRLRGVNPFPDSPNDFLRDYVRPAPELDGLRALERPILARALAPVPQDRWPTCIEMMRQLLSVIPVKSVAELPDRRAKVRHTCPHRPTVRLVTQGGQSGRSARVANVATNGIGLYSALPLGVGHEFLFMPPDTGAARTASADPPRMLSARVMRATMQQDGGWLLGCRLKFALDEAELNAFLPPATRPSRPD